MLSIEQRQRSLFYCGFYYTGKIDKIEGALTKKAYELFQKDHGLEVDSIYGPITDRMLIEAVKELQTMLNACGANLIVDGIIGQKTIAAIKAFQKENGLVVDGIAGVKTFAKLRAKAWSTVKYFKRTEFKCECGKYCDGYPTEPNFRLVQILDKLRAEFGIILVTSGVRCKKYNNSLAGSSPTSAHLSGCAADIYISGVTTSKDGREKVKKRAYALGAAYAYSDTPNMGNAVHINI